jgi:glycosyltransferase involved in cell wall biosynthesis
MRILITVPWGERLGGAEAMLDTALADAGERSDEVQLLFFEPGPWPEELRSAGFQVDVIHAGRLRELHRTAATVVRLARLIRRRAPDLVLNWSAKTQLYGSLAATLAGMRENVAWWQQVIPARDGALDRLATLLPARAVCCYSEAAARAQQQLTPRRRTLVIPPGAPIPAESRQPAPVRLPPGVPVVGIVGRLQPWKGQDRLLEAQAMLQRRGHRLHLLIVGGDSYGLSPQYAASLSALASRLGVSDAVTMTGQVSDAGPYIDRMDILVNASDPEPFGIVLLEGMARSVAVVAVDSGGPAEFIDNTRTGLLAASGASAALADAIEPLLISPSLRHELGRAGRERFLGEFTDVAMRRRLFGALHSIVEDRDERDPGARRPTTANVG